MNNLKSIKDDVKDALDEELENPNENQIPEFIDLPTSKYKSLLDQKREQEKQLA